MKNAEVQSVKIMVVFYFSFIGKTFILLYCAIYLFQFDFLVILKIYQRVTLRRRARFF